ncbi:helix-turn-helix domain-containing protein [Georgenia sp. SUBG003]|uniref:helix-turn-helix domain-containing protein n=1 Tax=Georgenia sp. SUBG003 TaxID=1497974 RepID=UPI003AB7B062
MFEPLGLSADAVEVYRVLLAHPDMSLDELAGRLSKDDDEVAQVLAMLGDKGFVRRSHSDPTNLRTESPQVAFERIIGQHEQELHRQQAASSSGSVSSSVVTGGMSRPGQEHRNRRVPAGGRGESQKVAVTSASLSPAEPLVYNGMTTGVSGALLPTSAPATAVAPSGYVTVHCRWSSLVLYPDTWSKGPVRDAVHGRSG